MAKLQPLPVNVQHIDLLTLPEVAQQELLTFYEFLLFKYESSFGNGKNREKQQRLTRLFHEIQGTLPTEYTFDRDELHER